jgi:hypothetical protein
MFCRYAYFLTSTVRILRQRRASVHQWADNRGKSNERKSVTKQSYANRSAVRIDSRGISRCRCGMMNVIKIGLKRSASVNETININSLVPTAVDSIMMKM